MFEVLCFQSMGVVNVSRDLSFFGRILNSEVNDSEPSSIEDFFLSFSEQVKELIFFTIGGGWGKGFGFIFGQVKFGLLDGFFFGEELIPGEDLGFGMISLSK